MKRFADETDLARSAAAWAIDAWARALGVSRAAGESLGAPPPPDRTVIPPLPPPQDDGRETAVSADLHGSQAWLGLNHPNVLRIHHVDHGGKDRDGFILMDFVEGRDLATLAPQVAFTVQDAVRVAAQVCEALAHIHQRGLVHREVQPSNIMVDPMSLAVTLLDSGLARPLHTTQNFTVVGEVVGEKSQYLSPEQADGRLDKRADLYALGVVLLELLLDGRGDADVSQSTPHEALDQLTGCPKELLALLRRLLEPDPSARVQHAEEASTALRALLPAEPQPAPLCNLVITLHGIRTNAQWQRAFAEVAGDAGLRCLLDRWNFGYFSIWRFLSPWARRAKVHWFRQAFRDQFGDLSKLRVAEDLPSIIAHSFGTYILGNALLRYPHLRFGNVLLCGSILPCDFPWDTLLERGQVQAVRNEYGTGDMWAKMVEWFIPGTGASGLTGFTREHERLVQNQYDFVHSEYFERGHMEDRWLPFLQRRHQIILGADLKPEQPRPRHRPWGAYMLYASLVAAPAAGVANALM